MTSEVREAAGRLRRLKFYGGGEWAEEVYGSEVPWAECHMRRDEHIVVAAYLAEHADIREALDTALRQWTSYYAEHNSKDIEDSPDSEAACYRRCMGALRGTPLQPIGQEQGK